MLPHQKFVFVPLEVEPQLGNAENVPLVRIDVDVVVGMRKRRSLKIRADGRRIVTLDLAFELGAEPLYLAIVVREFAATAADVQRVPADEFFLTRITQVLPARHPGDRGVRDVVRRRRLAQQAREKTVTGAAVEMFAKVLAQLAARVGDSGRPVARLRIEHDVRGFHAGSGKYHGFAIDFDFTPGLAVHASDSLGPSLVVHQDLAHQQVGEQRHLLGGFGFRQRKPRRRKESADFTAAAAVAAVVAGRVAVVGYRKLRTAIGQVGNADFFGAGFDNPIDAAERKRRKVVAIRIAGAILHGAGNTHVFFSFGKPGRDLGVVHRPVFPEAVEVRCLEIDVAKARRRTPPEVGFAARTFAALPVPVGSGSVRVGNIVLPDVGAFTVFGFFDGVVFLVGLVLERERIAVAAEPEVINLAMAAIVFIGLDAGTGVDRADFQASLAEYL